MNTNEIAELIQKYYNISGTYTSLGGFDDINNLIQIEEGKKIGFKDHNRSCATGVSFCSG